MGVGVGSQPPAKEVGGVVVETNDQRAVIACRLCLQDLGAMVSLTQA